MPERPRWLAERPSRKDLGSVSLVGTEQQIRATLSRRLDREPFPRRPGVELDVELVTVDGYQYLRLLPDPEDLEGEPAHERAVREP